MKFLITLLVTFIMTSFSIEDKEVYLCGPKGAKKYHYNKFCKGLTNCKHTIKKVSLSEAKELGLSLCGWED